MQQIFLSHGFELSEDELQKFEHFLSLFREYNAHTNLSAIRDEAGIIEKHFIDSLYGVTIISERFTHKGCTDYLPTQEGQIHPAIKLLDIGSGGGFPGIPLKIVMPELSVTLLDSVAKKVKAMNHFTKELGLTGIESIQDRAENLAKYPSYSSQYDIITSRATAYITDILTWSVPFLAKHGKILLYKTPSKEERKDMMKIVKKLSLSIEAEYEYTLSGQKRLILIFSKK